MPTVVAGKPQTEKRSEVIVELVADEVVPAEVEEAEAEVRYPDCVYASCSEVKLIRQNRSVEELVVDVEAFGVVEVDIATPTAQPKLATAKPRRRIRPLMDGLPRSKPRPRLQRMKEPTIRMPQNRRPKPLLLARETISQLLEDGETHHRQRN